jgi:rhodanese-related sulfurtransferase
VPDKTVSADEVRAALLAGEEVALLDVREEAEFATDHPLFAASASISTLEAEIYDRVPRRDTNIVCYSDGDARAAEAQRRLVQLGYTEVGVLMNGLAGWRDAGFELFRDVNAPSKAFGELVDATCHPPYIDAVDLEGEIEAGGDLLVVDVRRFDEYQTMSIPSATSVPGGELALRVQTMITSPNTRIIVNCAGRTRSIIGTQSLRNAGYVNPVAALRNGTIGWTLAGLELDHHADRGFPRAVEPDPSIRARANAHARASGVRWIGRDELREWKATSGVTTYLFDVRDPQEFAQRHRKSFRSAPGGQLVQETDVFAPVRGARIVLSDDDGIRASMTGSWLAQMGWQVAIIEGDEDDWTTGPWPSTTPAPPDVDAISLEELDNLLRDHNFMVIDLAKSSTYRAGHLPGAAFALRSELRHELGLLTDVGTVVLTSTDGHSAKWALADLGGGQEVRVVALEGGTASWVESGRALENDAATWLSDPTDIYRRPYEGTETDPGTMQAYLDWEYGLVAQLERDGTHHFFVICG